MRPSFLDTLRGEALKTKGSWGLTLSLLGPLAVSLAIFLFLLTEPERLQGETNPWFTLGRFHFNFFFPLYPLFAALIAYLLSKVEHRANGFKQLFSLPVPKFYFYISKLLLVLGWLAASMLLAIGLIYGMGYLLEWIYPQSAFDRFAPPAGLLLFMRNMGIALLAVLAIHFFLSIYFENFIISVGTACFLLISGMVAARWEYAYIFPYSYFSDIFWTYLTQGEVRAFTQREMWISAGYAIVFFTGGYYLFAKKQIKAGS